MVKDYNEGSGYIGLTSIVGLALFIVTLIQKNKNHHLPRSSTTLVLSAIPSLIFATQWPLYYIDESIVSSIPLLNQFRGSGRFIWVAFYTFGLVGSAVLLEYIKSISNNYYRASLFVLLCVVALFEAHQHLKVRAGVMKKYSGKDLFSENMWIANSSKESTLVKANISALITIPPSTVGSEKMDLYDDFFVKISSWPFAWQTGTPLTSINLSRTPLHSTLGILNLTCNTCFPFKEDSLLENEDYLIVIRNDLKKEYSLLVNRANLIDSTSHVSLYSITKDQLLWRKPNCSPFQSAVNVSNIYHRIVKKDTLIGQNIRPNEVIARVSLDSSCHKIYVSFWNKLRPNYGGRVGCKASFFSDEGHISYSSFSEMDISKFEVYNNWVNFSKEISVPDSATWFELSFEGLNAVVDNINVSCSN